MLNGGSGRARSQTQKESHCNRKRNKKIKRKKKGKKRKKKRKKKKKKKTMKRVARIEDQKGDRILRTTIAGWRNRPFHSDPRYKPFLGPREHDFGTPPAVEGDRSARKSE